MTTAREKLARQQHDMLEQILRAPAHSGKILAAKRRRELALAVPLLVETLGKRFPKLFARYIHDVGYPKSGGPTADAKNFCRWLLKSKTIPASLLTRAAAVITQHRWTPTLAHSQKSHHLAWRGKVIQIF